MSLEPYIQPWWLRVYSICFSFSKFGTSALGGWNPIRDYDMDRSREYKYSVTAIQIAGCRVTVILITVSNRALAEMIAKASSIGEPTSHKDRSDIVHGSYPQRPRWKFVKCVTELKYRVFHCKLTNSRSVLG